MEEFSQLTQWKSELKKHWIYLKEKSVSKQNHINVIDIRSIYS